MLSLRVRVSLFSARSTPSMKAAPPSRFSCLSKTRRAKQQSQGASNLCARSPRCTLIHRRVLYVRISAHHYIERLYTPRWTRAGHCHLSIADSCVAALAPWKDAQWMKRGVPLGMVYRRKVVLTDASNIG